MYDAIRKRLAVLVSLMMCMFLTTSVVFAEDTAPAPEEEQVSEQAAEEEAPAEQLTEEPVPVEQPAEETVPEEQSTEEPGSENSVQTSGSCGPRATWTITGTGTDLTLTISGRGSTDHYFYDVAQDCYPQPWSAYRDDIRTVVVESGITSIGRGVFANFSNLNSVTLPDTLKVIGPQSFIFCRSLTDIQIPDSVTEIQMDAFAFCTGLTSFRFPSGMTQFYTSSLKCCTGLKSLTIPAGIRDIYACDDMNCTGLTKLILPKSLVTMDENVFDGCPTDIAVYYAGTEEEWNAIQGSQFQSVIHDRTPNTDAGLHFLGLTEDGIVACGSNTTIDWAVTGTGSDMTLTIRTAGDTAVIDVDRHDPPWAEYKSSIRSIVIGEGVTGIGWMTFAAYPEVTDVVIPGSLTGTWQNAFCGCVKLKNVTIGEGVTTIDAGALQGCTALTSIVLPSSVTTLAPAAFDACGFTSLTVPNSVTTIGSCAFSNCNGLKSVTIPATVTSIDRDAFYNCPNLKNIMFKGTAAQWKAATGDYFPPEQLVTFADGTTNQPTQVTTPSTTTKPAAKATTVKLKKPTLKVQRSKRKNKLTWNKVSGATGYQIYIRYPGKKTYKKALTKSSKVKSITHKGLKKGKVYYYKVRAYKKVGKKIYYSPFSKVIKVRVK